MPTRKVIKGKIIRWKNKLVEVTVEKKKGKMWRSLIMSK